jgi:hypothetical protein
MGIIDRCTYTLHCKQCNTTESQSVVDSGSSWSGSFWSSGPSFHHFDTEWEGSGKTEPDLVAVKCKQCGQQPEVNSKYSM